MGRVWVVLAMVAFLTTACGSRGHKALSNKLVLDHSIGGISLGEVRSVAESALGKGVVVSATIDRSARPTPERVVKVSYPNAGIVVWWVSGQGHPARAFILQTRSPRYRTATGIGVGSTLVKLRSIGVFCNVGSDCQHGYGAPNGKGTTFRRAGPGGRVSEVLMSYGH